MKSIPWFVFNNRVREEVKVDVVRERRAIINSTFIGVILMGLITLTACYCPKLFIVILALFAIIGFFGFLRMVFKYCRGDKL